MEIVLSDRDVLAVQEVSSTLLSVADYPDVATWASEVLAASSPLLGADRMFLALPDGDAFQMIGSDGDLAEAQAAYIDHFHKLDVFLGERRRALGLEVLTHEMLLNPGDEETEFWTDWVLKYRVCDPAGIALDVAGVPVPASFMAYRDRSGTGGFGPRGHALLSLLKPSFEAAVRTLLRVRFARSGLGSQLDALECPAVLFGAGGTVAHANPAVAATFGRHASAVLAAVAPVARAAMSSAVGSSTLARQPAHHPPSGSVTVPGLGEVSYTVLLWSGADGRPTAIVHFQAGRVSVASVPHLCERFGLTPRQAQVAQLLARRRSNDEIAEALSISPHTAKRHTEMVMRRLRVRSRLEVELRMAEMCQHQRDG